MVVRPSRLPPQVRPRAASAGSRKSAIRAASSSSSGSSRRIEATFGFIDMAGFTALTEQHEDFDAADMATRFAALTAPRSRRATG